MKITANEEYGLRCLMRLARLQERPPWLPGEPALAEGYHPFPRWSTIREVATAEGLSIPYAAKLLRLLRLAGLIESDRGGPGGYRLARPPAEVRLGAVLLALSLMLLAFNRRHALAR